MLQKAEHSSAISCGLAAFYANNSGFKELAESLACPFPRPVRLRHRGKLLDVSVSSPPQSVSGLVAVQVSGQPWSAQGWHLQYGGVDLFVEDASFEPAVGASAGSMANELRAPFNGKLIAVKTAVGARVQRGDPLLVIESMKLEHSIAAPRDGMVQAVMAEPGQQVAPGQLLVTLEAAP